MRPGTSRSLRYSPTRNTTKSFGKTNTNHGDDPRNNFKRPLPRVGPVVSPAAYPHANGPSTGKGEAAQPHRKAGFGDSRLQSRVGFLGCRLRANRSYSFGHVESHASGDRAALAR